MAFSPGTAHSPEIQSYRTWCGAASPILNDTPVVYIRPIIENSYKECIYIYVYIYIYILTQSFWTGTKVIRRKHIIQPTGFGACSSTCCQWDGEDVPAPWERSNSHLPVRVQKPCVNQFIQYNLCSRWVFVISNSKLRNCVIVAIECFFATIDRCSVMTGMYRRSVMIYSSQ